MKRICVGMPQTPSSKCCSRAVHSINAYTIQPDYPQFNGHRAATTTRSLCSRALFYIAMLELIYI